MEISCAMNTLGNMWVNGIYQEPHVTRKKFNLNKRFVNLFGLVNKNIYTQNVLEDN